jgi:hypothetical protein
MANNLAILDHPTKALCLPDFLGRLAIGTVQWPGQPTRRYLAGGLSLTSSQRAEAERARVVIDDALSPFGSAGDKARAVILSKMILASGGAALTERAAEAKAEAYRDAVDDMPPWAIAEAVKRWHRGQCGDHNYSFAPAPAVLRDVVNGILQPYREAAAKIDMALSTVSLDRAMDSTPIEREKSLVPNLRRV